MKRRIPANGTAPRHHLEGGPLHGHVVPLWSRSTLPIRVSGKAGEYRARSESFAGMVWHPVTYPSHAE